MLCAAGSGALVRLGGHVHVAQSLAHVMALLGLAAVPALT